MVALLLFHTGVLLSIFTGLSFSIRFLFNLFSNFFSLFWLLYVIRIFVVWRRELSIMLIPPGSHCVTLTPLAIASKRERPPIGGRPVSSVRLLSSLFCSVTGGCKGWALAPISIFGGLAASGTLCTKSTWSIPLSRLAPVTFM